MQVISFYLLRLGSPDAILHAWARMFLELASLTIRESRTACI